MPTVKARKKKSLPTCPDCGVYVQEKHDYGIIEHKRKSNGYWFKFKCPNCSTKRKKQFVIYNTDSDFNLVRG